MNTGKQRNRCTISQLCSCAATQRAHTWVASWEANLEL